ncbi:MAG: DUF4340 domain-containing protein, partial [Proteobacteria bacterium]
MNKTGGFALFVAILLGITYYTEFYAVEKEAEKKAVLTRVISDKADHIQQVQVDNSKGRIVIKRDADGWTLTEPEVAPADNQYVEEFVNALANEQSTEAAVEGDKIDWNLYGLATDFAVFTFTSNQGASTAISISSKKNFEGNSFLRRNQETKVLISGAQWQAKSQLGFTDFKDKRLYRGKIGAIDSITVKGAKADVHVVLKDSLWLSPEQPAIKLNQNRVREILTSLNQIQATDYVNKDELKKLKLESKSVLKLGLTDKVWSAELKQAADKTIYAVISEQDAVARLQPGQA